MAAPLGSFDWNDARVALIEQRWLAGHTALSIAQELGNDVTKGAVSAKLKRLGFTKTRDQASVGGVHTQRIVPATVRRPAPASTPPVLLPAEAIPLEQRRSFLELEDGQCKYPYGTPGGKDFFFCGAGALEARPYCVQHFRLCCPGMRA